MRGAQIDGPLMTALYQSAVYRGDWQPALLRFRTLLGSVEAALTVFEPDLASLRAETNGHILSAGVRAQYVEHYGYYDPKLRILAREAPGFLFNDARLFDRDFVRHDPFYQEFSLPIGGGHTLHMVLSRAATENIYLAVMRAHRQTAYDGAAERTFRKAAPHFLQAVKLKQKIETAQLAAASARAALDRVAFGVIVLDGGGRVTMANRAAEEATAPGEPLQVRQQRFTARAASLAAHLEALIRSALGGMAGAMRAPRANGTSWNVSVAPLPEHTGISPAGEPGALVLIGRPEMNPAMPCEELMALYGLTPAEAKLATLLAGGTSLSQAAGQRGVRLSTVRSQLLQVLQKTGAHSQSDLMRLVCALPGTLFGRRH